MKKTLLALAFVSFLFASCEKKQNVIPVVPEQQVPEDSTYIINGITDFSIGSLDSTVVILNVNFIQGKQEKITLKIEGMPDRTNASLEPSAGIPGFNTMLKLTANVAKPGTYPLTITGTSTSGLKKTYKVNLIIKDNFYCDSMLTNDVGFFITRHTNGDYIQDYTHINTMYVSADSPFVFYLSQLYLEVYNAVPVLTTGFSAQQASFSYNCDGKTITLHEKMVDAVTTFGTQWYKVSGTGTINYDTKTVSITYTVVNPQNTEFKYNLTADIFM